MGNHSAQQSDLREDYRKALTRFNRGKVALVRSIFKNLTEVDGVKGKTIDKETFLEYFPLPGIMGERLYAVFDRDSSGGVDFQEFLTGMALIYRGTVEEKKKFLFEMYDLDGDGFVTREDLRTMLSHIPAAFKILDTLMSEKSGVPVPFSENRGTSAEDAETKQRIEQIIDTAFAHRSLRPLLQDSHEQHLTFNEFAEVVSQCPAIVEIINIFYDEAIPEDAAAARTSMITDGNMPRVSMWSACQSGGQSGRSLLRQSVLQRSKAEARVPAAQGGGGSSASNASPSVFGGVVRKLSSFTSHSSRNSDTYSAQSTMDSLDTAKGELRDQYCNDCPMCGTVTTLCHCMQCGGTLRPGPGVEYKCEGCGWELAAVKFCHQCGQSLQRQRQVLSPSAGARSGPLAPSEHGRQPRSTSPDSERSCVSCNSNTSGSTGSQSQPAGAFSGFSLFARQCSPSSESSNAGGQSSCSSTGGGVGSRMPFFPRSRDQALIVKNGLLEEKGGCADRAPPAMQGTLWKVGRHAKMQKSRYFVLHERILYYFNKQGDRIPKGVILLDGCTFTSEVQEVPKGKFGLGVQQRNVADKRIFWCSTVEERTAWLTALTAATRSPAIEEFYHLSNEELGRGKFAAVVQARARDDPRTLLAVKVINKRGISEEDREHLRTEVAILKLVDHENVVRLVDVFDEPERVCLVMGHGGGGDLLKRLLQLPEQRLDEPTSRTVLGCLLSGTQYLHEHGITHRDLKPENALIEDVASDGSSQPRISSAKITDFGLSAITAKNMKEPLGTMAYAAPEILQGKPYDWTVDIWSLGVMAFAVLAGLLPFVGDCDRTVAKAVVQGQYSFDSPRWTHVSLAARDFIKSLLRHKPSDRPSAGVALSHRWFLDVSSSTEH